MNTEPLRDFFRAYPGLAPGAAITIIVGFIFSRRVARAMGVPRFVAWLLVLGVGLVIAATLTPGREPSNLGAQGRGACDLGRLTPAPLGEILQFDDASSNIILFIPLGLALGLARRSRRKLLLIAGSCALPFVVEALQLAAPALGRACQSADAIDNLTGLVIGLVCGTVLGAFFKTEHGPGRSQPGTDPG